MSVQRKRVLVWGLTSNIGGLEMVVKNYVDHISPLDVQFDFVATCDRMAFEDWVLDRGGEVIHLPSRARDPIGYRKAIKCFSRERLNIYDAVWLNDCRWGNLDILEEARTAGVALRIAHAHNTRDVADGWLRIMRHKVNRIRLASLATDFWACSQPAAEWCFDAAQLSSRHFRIIQNAVDVERFSYDESARSRARKQLKLGNQTIYINVGRLDHQKNQRFLLEAFKELTRLRPNSILLLVGVGPDEEALRAMVDALALGDKVRFLGFRDDVPFLLCAADCFVMPSTFEGLGLVLVEAQASGLPCLCSDAITSEVEILDSLKRLPLSAGAQAWAKYMSQVEPSATRKVAAASVRAAGYDIASEASRMAGFFITDGLRFGFMEDTNSEEG
ncbi:glycosyltransferase [Collinsella sp. SGI.033]|uniref:glycosyltransferase n=1 Tax=Collinsella sp. SGI.033 TaxID=3420552 RepID=UPI003D03AADF